MNGKHTYDSLSLNQTSALPNIHMHITAYSGVAYRDDRDESRRPFTRNQEIYRAYAKLFATRELKAWHGSAHAGSCDVQADVAMATD